MEKLELNYYIGTNGTILTHVDIPGATAIKKVRLIADSGKKVTKNDVDFYESVLIPAGEVAEWREVKGQD